jgi:hypothetical protein
MTILTSISSKIDLRRVIPKTLNWQKVPKSSGECFGEGLEWIPQTDFEIMTILTSISSKPDLRRVRHLDGV